MSLEELIGKIDKFKGHTTHQSSKMDTTYTFENEYMCVKRIDTSNKHGGQSIENGKQWSIIFEKKKDFAHLVNWKLLKNHYGNNLNITKVRSNRNKPSKYENCYGIRFYEMSKDPTHEIIYDILNFIFI